MQANSNSFIVEVLGSASQVSPDGTRLDINTPPGVKMIDKDGAQWTVLAAIGGVAGQIGLARNGVRVASSIDFATIKAGVIFQSDFGSGQGWSRWTGTAWTPSAAP